MGTGTTHVVGGVFVDGQRGKKNAGSGPHHAVYETTIETTTPSSTPGTAKVEGGKSKNTNPTLVGKRSTLAVVQTHGPGPYVGHDRRHAVARQKWVGPHPPRHRDVEERGQDHPARGGTGPTGPASTDGRHSTDVGGLENDVSFEQQPYGDWGHDGPTPVDANVCGGKEEPECGGGGRRWCGGRQHGSNLAGQCQSLGFEQQHHPRHHDVHECVRGLEIPSGGPSQKRSARRDVCGQGHSSAGVGRDSGAIGDQTRRARHRAPGGGGANGHRGERRHELRRQNQGGGRVAEHRLGMGHGARSIDGGRRRACFGLGSAGQTRLVEQPHLFRIRRGGGGGRPRRPPAPARHPNVWVGHCETGGTICSRVV